MTCTILKCNDPEVEIANSQSIDVCNVTYGSNCSLNCSSGFSVSGNGEHVCDDVNDEGTSVKWRSRTFKCITAGEIIDHRFFLIFLSLFSASSSETTSVSAGVAIGGAVGGAIFLIIIIIALLVLSVLLCMKYSRSKKGFPISRPKKGNS